MLILLFFACLYFSLVVYPIRCTVSLSFRSHDVLTRNLCPLSLPLFSFFVVSTLCFGASILPLPIISS